MRAALLALLLGLTGCCTYQGKAVSRRTADDMRRLGMDVHCPGDPNGGIDPATGKLRMSMWQEYQTASLGSCDRRHKGYRRHGRRRYGKTL